VLCSKKAAVTGAVLYSVFHSIHPIITIVTTITTITIIIVHVYVKG
jgi:hypothetical protein